MGTRTTHPVSKPRTVPRLDRVEVLINMELGRVQNTQSNLVRTFSHPPPSTFDTWLTSFVHVGARRGAEWATNAIGSDAGVLLAALLRSLRHGGKLFVATDAGEYSMTRGIT